MSLSAARNAAGQRKQNSVGSLRFQRDSQGVGKCMTVRELLDKPEKWTQGGIAKTVTGEVVESYDIGAISWCLLGALDKCYGNNASAFYAAQSRLLARLSDTPISVWNDSPRRTFEEVRAVVESACI